MNPFLEREWRERFRNPRSAWWLFGLVAALVVLLSVNYNGWLQQHSPTGNPVEPWVINRFGRDSFAAFAVFEVLIALLAAPSLTAGTLAGERERGSLDLLLLSHLSPLQIVIGRWGAGVAFLWLLLIVLVPFHALLFFAGVQIGPILIVLALAWGSAAFGSALGIAVSAWGRRAHLALRSANSLTILWLVASLLAASLFGIGPNSHLGTQLVVWFGNTNPVLAVFEVTDGGTDGTWLWALSAMLVGTLVALWLATRGLLKVPDEAPFVEAKLVVGAPEASAPPNSRFVPQNQRVMAVPFLADLQSENVIFARELRSRFRMRRPPLLVLIFEALLALGVGVTYLFVFVQTLIEPSARPVVFWGVVFTALVVTLLSCSTLGALAFSREREGGTWESLKLALFSPRELVMSKFWAITITPLLFSLPFWPLVVPCVAWNAGLAGATNGNFVSPLQLVGAVLVWLGSMALMSAGAMWVGAHAHKTDAANGWALFLGVIWTLIWPVMAAFLTFSGAPRFDASTDWIGITTPFLAIALVVGQKSWLWTAGVPFAVFCALATWLILRQAEAVIALDMTRDLSSGRA